VFWKAMRVYSFSWESKMQMISPHFKRAFLDGDPLNEYMTQVELLGNVISSAGFGLLLVTANQHIACANKAAEMFMRTSRGLSCEHGYINAMDFKTARKLRSLISAASQPRDEPLAGGSIVLRNEDEQASLVVHVVPLSAPFTVLLPDNERPVCGLFIVDCQRGTAARVHVFADLFNLTSAQVRVLAQVISGEGLTMAARRLNIARSTARSHLDDILQKTGTHRQAELVRVFFETTIPGQGPVRHSHAAQAFGM
jgi:DNA-binding CsgD family transcriptional regulator